MSRFGRLINGNKMELVEKILNILDFDLLYKLFLLIKLNIKHTKNIY